MNMAWALGIAAGITLVVFVGSAIWETIRKDGRGPYCPICGRNDVGCDTQGKSGICKF